MTLIPNFAKSLASGSVIALTAPLVAEYATLPDTPSYPWILEVLTMTPLSPSLFGTFLVIAWATSLATLNVPIPLI